VGEVVGVEELKERKRVGEDERRKGDVKEREEEKEDDERRK